MARGIQKLMAAAVACWPFAAMMLDVDLWRAAVGWLLLWGAMILYIALAKIAEDEV